MKVISAVSSILEALLGENAIEPRLLPRGLVSPGDIGGGRRIFTLSIIEKKD
jgi:hypothetical protein